MCVAASGVHPLQRRVAHAASATQIMMMPPRQLIDDSLPKRPFADDPSERRIISRSPLLANRRSRYLIVDKSAGYTDEVRVPALCKAPAMRRRFRVRPHRRGPL